MAMHTVKTPDELLNSHECDTLLFDCIDYRYREATQQFVKESLGIAQFDGPISIPGVCKGIAEGNNMITEFIKYVIATAIKVHNIKRVIIVHHATCGAYGIDDADVELQKQIEDLKKGDAILGDLFPDLSFQLFFAKKGEGEIIYTPIT